MTRPSQSRLRKGSGFAIRGAADDNERYRQYGYGTCGEEKEIFVSNDSAEWQVWWHDASMMGNDREVRDLRATRLFSSCNRLSSTVAHFAEATKKKKNQGEKSNLRDRNPVQTIKLVCMSCLTSLHVNK